MKSVTNGECSIEHMSTHDILKSWAASVLPDDQRRDHFTGFELNDIVIFEWLVVGRRLL
jgi:hypothetical protein